MADMVISAVVKKLVDIAGNLVVKEGSRLFRLKKDILWIEREMRYIQSYLKDVDANQRKSGGGLLTELIRDIWDLAYDAEDIIDDYFPKLESLGRKDKKDLLGWLKSATGILLNGKTVRDFAVEIEDLKNRVEDINRLRQTYKIEEISSCSEGDTWDPRQSFPHSHGGEANVIGFDNHIKELLGILLDKVSQHRVVSIVGMAGLGKTTLSKQVYKIVQQKFKRSAWVYVSQQPNINQILHNIAVQVGLEEEKCKHNLVTHLYNFLSQQTNVIVIDDIWDSKHWNALKNAIPTNSKNGSRIIITSRNKDVGINIGGQVGGQSFLHELHPLDQENSRELFLKMIMAAPNNNNGSCDLSQLMENVGEQILRKCDGVPLAIVVTIGLLLSRERTKQAWKGVLECMGQPDEDQYSGIFDLSYKDLPYELKPCFLYFGLFPEDYEISAFKLINLWVAEGFIRDSGSKASEDVGNDYLDHLIGRNMIQVVQRSFNGRVKSCHIHDILYTLCIQEAEKINFFHTYGDKTTRSSTKGIRRVAAHGIDFFDYISLGYQTPKLRTMLCLQGDLQKPRKERVKNFLGDLKFLRALNVKCSGYGHRLLLNEIGNLIHLIYLRLGGEVDLVLPSTMSNLKNLQTLDLRGSGRVVFLPSVIWQMKELKHILLPNFVSGTQMSKSPPIEFSLPNLQTLYRLPVLIFEADWLYKLTNLRRLLVTVPTNRMIEVLSDATPISDRLEELLISNANDGEILDLSRYKNLQLLFLKNTPIAKLHQSKSLVPSLTELTLIRTVCQTDPMKILGKLPKLKFLNLGKDAYIGKKMVCSGKPGTFPQLEVLKIGVQKNLEELMIEAGAFPQLEVLKIGKQNFPMLFNEAPEIEEGVMSKSMQKIVSSEFDEDSDGEELEISKCELMVEEGGMPALKYFTVHERVRVKVPERIRNIMTSTKKVEPGFYTLKDGSRSLLLSLETACYLSISSPLSQFCDLIACNKGWCFLVL